jgi:hypothetical protein
MVQNALAGHLLHVTPVPGLAQNYSAGAGGHLALVNEGMAAILQRRVWRQAIGVATSGRGMLKGGLGRSRNDRAK